MCRVPPIVPDGQWPPTSVSSWSRVFGRLAVAGAVCPGRFAGGIQLPGSRVLGIGRFAGGMYLPSRRSRVSSGDLQEALNCPVVVRRVSADLREACICPVVVCRQSAGLQCLAQVGGFTAAFSSSTYCRVRFSADAAASGWVDGAVQ